jgi:hypothetical protein
MRTTTAFALTTILFVLPAVARAQQPLAAEVEAAAFKQLAAGIPPGSRIKLQTRGGRRLTANLMAAGDDAIIVKRESRVPEAALTVLYAELTRLQLEERSGFSMGKALGIGLAAGVGAILTLFAIAVSIDD